MGEDKAHSSIGASSCERWWNCAGSVALIEAGKYPSKPSVYSAEGVVAHSLCEEMLTAKIKSRAALRDLIGTERKADGFTIKIDEEMVDSVLVYVDTILADLAEMKASKKTAPIVWKAEERIVVSSADPKAYGTLDFGMYRKGDVLYIEDFKYGKGVPVGVMDNKQLMYYACGFMDTVAGWAFDKVVLKIIQPRAPHADGPVREWEVGTAQLGLFRDELKKRIEATRQKGAKLEAGDWCKFCPALAACPAMYQKAQDIAKSDFSMPPATNAVAVAVSLPIVPSLTAQQLADGLKWGPIISSFFEAMRQRAKEMLEAAQEVPGFKLVRSKSDRQWKDEEAVKERYKLMGMAIYTEPKLMSPAQLEKKVGRDAIAEMTYKLEGSLTVAPMSDPRPAAVISAAADFASVTLDDGLKGLL